MELLDNLYSLIEGWILEFTTIRGGLQLGMVVGCAFLALLTHRRWQAFITKLLGDLEHNRFFQFFLRGSDRATFPLSMLLYLIIVRFLLSQVGINVAVLDVFTPLLLSLAAIRLVVYTLRIGFTPSPALRAWETVISFGAWTIVALHLVGWLKDILDTLDSIGFSTGDDYFSILSILKLLFAIVIFMLGASWLSRLIESRAKKSPNISASLRVGLAKVSKFSLYALAFIFSLNIVGIDLTTFAVFGGAIGVGIGFGLQKIFSNFISGFILLFDRSIRPGDVISIGDRFGWVQALHARYVVVRDRDGVETLIPNENLITSEVINWSYSDRQIRVRIPIQISYDDDPEMAMALLIKACEGQKRILSKPAVAARLTGFGDNGIDLELRIWLRDPESGVANVRSDLYVKIWKLFKENNVSIPFPQRDVHIISNPEAIQSKQP